MSGHRYGNLDIHGKAGEPYQRLDASQAILSSYKMYRTIADEVVSEERWTEDLDDALVEGLYSEACRLLEGYGQITDGREAVMKILNGIEKEHDGTGLYLSALLNKTGIDYMRIDRYNEYDFLGYRLGDGKTIAVSHVPVHSIGRYGKGVVLSWAEPREMAMEAEAGFYANWGTVIETMSEGAKGGLHVNFGTVGRAPTDWIMSSSTKGGVHVNFGSCDYLGIFEQGGFHINAGKRCTMGSVPTNVQLDLERGTYNLRGFNGRLNEIPAGLHDSVMLEIKKIRALKFQPAFTERTIQELMAFDFSSTEKRLAGLHERINNEILSYVKSRGRDKNG